MEIIQRFELRVFRYGVIIAVVFRFIRSAHEFMIDSPMPILLLGVFNLFLFVIIFLLCRRHFQISFVIFFFQILVTSVLTWNNAGGWNGSVPYLLLVAMVGIAITSHGLLQITTLLAYGITILLFHLTPILDSFSSFNSKYSLLSREVDFLINTAVLISVTFYLKENFISYRKSVEITHERLKRSSQKLLDQTKELQQQQADLNRLRNDLEKIIPGKISEAQNKAEMLKEYSFINSHHVRAPLARVLGLIHLIELEQNGQNSAHDALRNIKNDAEEIDMILTKVNTIIS
jgi:signal transduction histidine kinase